MSDKRFRVVVMPRKESIFSKRGFVAYFWDHRTDIQHWADNGRVFDTRTLALDAAKREIAKIKDDEEFEKEKEEVLYFD